MFLDKQVIAVSIANGYLTDGDGMPTPFSECEVFGTSKTRTDVWLTIVSHAVSDNI